MKKYIFIFIILQIFIINSYANNSIIISKDYVNFRTQPSLKSKVLKTLIKGTSLNLISQNKNWYQVSDEFPGETNGWIHKSCAISYQDYINNIDKLFKKNKLFNAKEILSLAVYYQKGNKINTAKKLYNILITKYPRTPYLAYETNIGMGMQALENIFSYYEDTNIIGFINFSDKYLKSKSSLIKSYIHYLRGKAYYKNKNYKNSYSEFSLVITKYSKIKYGKYIEEIGYYGSFAALKNIYILYSKNHLDKTEFAKLLNRILKNHSDQDLINFANMYYKKLKNKK